MAGESPLSSLPNLSRVDDSGTVGRSPREYELVSRYARQHPSFPIYFASIYAMQFHPGAGTRGHRPLSAAECARKAIDCVLLETE